jgi:hypothetical protein
MVQSDPWLRLPTIEELPDSDELPTPEEQAAELEAMLNRYLERFGELPGDE